MSLLDRPKYIHMVLYDLVIVDKYGYFTVIKLEKNLEM